MATEGNTLKRKLVLYNLHNKEENTNEAVVL